MKEFQLLDIGYQPPVKPKILLVDDENALQMVMIDILGGDYEIIPAYNGREGVEKAKNILPDLIIMDMMMPDMTGFEAVQALTAEKITRSIPVIVTTAQNYDHSTVHVIKMEPNVVAFLPKPFKAQVLRDLVKSALEKNKPS